MAEVIHQIELHRRGETPAQSAFRVLQAANQLGLEGCKIVGLKEHYRLGDLTMDVIVERNGDVLVLNRLGDGFDLHSGAAEIPREARCVVALDGTWIKCLGCGLTSYNVNDVQKLYCGQCRCFHGDLGWPRPEDPLAPSRSRSADASASGAVPRDREPQ